MHEVSGAAFPAAPPRVARTRSERNQDERRSPMGSARPPPALDCAAAAAGLYAGPPAPPSATNPASLEGRPAPARVRSRLRRQRQSPPQADMETAMTGAAIAMRTVR